MHSILDIDLDYFNLMPNAPDHLHRILTWANCPVTLVVEQHNDAYSQWRKQWRRDNIAPSHILHVDEHHDMMDQRRQVNIGNFMYHAMRLWPMCRVHWQVQVAIDSPGMWLANETWSSLRPRFSQGPHRPAGWPKPDVVTVCTSPDFMVPSLAATLMDVSSAFMANKQGDGIPQTQSHRRQATNAHVLKSAAKSEQRTLASGAMDAK